MTLLQKQRLERTYFCVVHLRPRGITTVLPAGRCPVTAGRRRARAEAARYYFLDAAANFCIWAAASCGVILSPPTATWSVKYLSMSAGLNASSMIR